MPEFHLEAGVPKYIQISHWLTEMIQKGRYAVNDKLPSESKLSELFHVNRNTVRQAISDLGGKGPGAEEERGWVLCHRPAFSTREVYPPAYLQLHGRYDPDGDCSADETDPSSP